jgi:hypothetical protein
VRIFPLSVYPLAISSKLMQNTPVCGFSTTDSSKNGGSVITNSFSSLTIAWLALAAGVAGLLALAFIVLFFTVGQPFGTLNDISIGVAGVLSGVLAWMLYSENHAQVLLLSRIALGLALLGALVVAIGSILVLFGVKGWYLAGLYMAAGNALIGLWLFVLCCSLQQGDGWPRGLVLFGLVVGVVMALGLAAIPGIFRGIDSWDAAPWYINIGQVGGLGYLVLYPTWCVLLGRIISLN